MNYCPLLWIIDTGLYILLAAQAPFQLWHCFKLMSRSHHDKDDCVSTCSLHTSKRWMPASERSCQHTRLISLVAENSVWSLSRIWHNETSTGTTLKYTFTQSPARTGACWTCHSQCSQTLGCYCNSLPSEREPDGERLLAFLSVMWSVSLASEYMPSSQVALETALRAFLQISTQMANTPFMRKVRPKHGTKSLS